MSPAKRSRPSVRHGWDTGAVTIVLPTTWGTDRWWAPPGRAAHRLLVMVASASAASTPAAVRLTGGVEADVDALIVRLFEVEGHSLVRLARLFVDDRNAAEDLVQEAFIRLARSAHRIQDPAKAAAYLRSIVLNLARDHNRRGFVSVRHQLPFDDHQASIEDQIDLQDDQRRVLDALRDLAPRQRDCLVLRYFHELGIDDIASTLGLSRNSVKTHLQRGLAAMERRLES
jgi:RNA polymerase sigma factor (sigma-70 family)